MKHPRKEQQFNQLKVLFIFNINTASLLQYACQNVCKHLRAMTQWEVRGTQKWLEAEATTSPGSLGRCVAPVLLRVLVYYF